MYSTYSKKWSAVVFVLSSFILFFYIKEGLFSLNFWLYHATGDALKNYFNVAEVAKSSDFFWLDKVNYPFGEQIFFLDSQPAIAKLIGWFHLEEYSIAFVNFLPFLSISLTTIPIFLIQRELKIPLLLNIFSAITIAFLSPQIARIPVHYALSYGLYIPLLLYFLIAKFKSENLRYLFVLILVVLFSFIHPYYLLIGVVLLSSYLFYHVFYQFSFKNLFLNLCVLIIPLIIIKLILSFTDPILDRPEIPFGILHYKSTFASVFSPPFKPFVEIISNFFNLPKGTFEGNAYVGILGFPILIYTIYKLIRNFISKQSVVLIFRNEKFFYLFIASFVIWTFALYSPVKFIINPLMEAIPILKQFRSLGRFGWIFYYVFSIFITIKLSDLYRFLKSNYNIHLAWLSVLVLSLLWYLDANGNLNIIKDKIEKRQYVSFNNSKYLSKEETDVLRNSNYDAILSLPIFSVGSEIENYIGSGYSVLETFTLSSILNVPYVSTYSSRVSAAQFYQIKELKEKGDVEKFFKRREKLLFVVDINNLSEIEQKILNEAKIIFQKDFIVYAAYQVKN